MSSKLLRAVLFVCALVAPLSASAKLRVGYVNVPAGVLTGTPQQTLDAALDRIEHCKDCTHDERLRRELAALRTSATVVTVQLRYETGKLKWERMRTKNMRRTDDHRVMLKGLARDVIITWNLAIDAVPGPGDCHQADPVSNLSHELHHAYQLLYAIPIRPADHFPVDPNEADAVSVENIYRRCAGMCQRDHYGFHNVPATTTCPCDPSGNNGPQRCTSPLLICCDNGCIDWRADAGNCGGCHVTCEQGTAPACCNGACADLDNDPRNCGACGNSCDVNSGCCHGTCLDLRSDTGNCGACGRTCGTGEVCGGGNCYCSDCGDPVGDQAAGVCDYCPDRGGGGQLHCCWCGGDGCI
jgi:hypothetical protein